MNYEDELLLEEIEEGLLTRHNCNTIQEVLEKLKTEHRKLLRQKYKQAHP
ncbi:MAG: hypothetical protein KKF65_00770 [Nanoarchaeota archaeon]|nr:hypothetical protein [Nanoarchaeota archaeon]